MDATAMGELLTRKEKLLPELKPFEYTGPLGLGVYHPLLIEMFYNPEHCALLNLRYREKKRAVAEARAERKWSSYIWLHERPYRIRALLDAMRSGMKDPHELIASVWIDSENIWQHKSEWLLIWKDLANPHLVMDANERTVFDYMPETLTIFRGIRHRTHWLKGLSWTRDKERAVWFAHRLATKKNRPVVVEAKVNKADVLAFFNGRNEEEIVVLPRKVEIVKKDER